MFGAHASANTIRVECDQCGEKMLLERRYHPSETERFCICVFCEARLMVDLRGFASKPIHVA
jgi:predicted SprT family Zn-dependent metalloprotease